MSHITYRATNFGPQWGSNLSGTNSLAISWHDLVWAAITVGKPGIAYLFTHGWHSISDAIVRSHTVYANLCQASDRYQKSTLYESMDPSEKGAASYFMGMIAAKILCERLLNVPLVLHLSMVDDIGIDIRLIGRSEPDLIGLDRNGKWIVAETKGRSNAYDASAMSAAKAQTRQLRKINGSFPNLRVAIQAYFSPDLRFAIEDPDEYDEDAIDIELNVDSAIRRYYSYPYKAAQSQEEERKISGQTFYVQKIEEIGVTIGLSENIKNILEDEKEIDFVSLRTQSTVSDNVITDTGQIFSDGIFIELDNRWSKEYMSKQPSSRKGR